jgi:hypothetical protein
MLTSRCFVSGYRGRLPAPSWIIAGQAATSFGPGSGSDGSTSALGSKDDTSPAAWIRHRLERCRLDLANPRLKARPIQAIAERLGFTNPTHFSRLFRATYGIPPRDYRNLPPKACANRQHPCAE